MRTVDDFLRWEQASRDTIDVKRCYIDLAGDLVSGVLLSQIIFWFLPSDKGSKLRVEHEGLMWLAKHRADWWAECRITPKQFDRAIRALADRGLVFHKRFRFGGSPTVHVWLNWPAVAEGVNSILTFGEIASVPSGQLELDERDRTITETTSETTSETTDNDDRPAELGEFEQNLGVMLTPLVADLDDFVVYSPANLNFLDRLRHESGLSLEEIKAVATHLRTNESYFIEDGNIIYIAKTCFNQRF